MDFFLLAVLIFCLFPYLLGSLPSGLLIGKFFGQGDIREIGSKNIGATNMLRTGRKDLAFLTLLFDFLKGFAVIAFLNSWSSDMPELISISVGIASLLAVLGHCFPIWLQFKGGKGVATGLGVTFALSWVVGLVAAAVWLIAAALFRRSSLAALLAVLSIMMFALITLPVLSSIWVVTYCLVIIAKHHENIRRLIAGTEPKIGSK